MSARPDPNTTGSILLHLASQEQSVLYEILATLPYSVFWKDTDFRYLGCNQAFAEATGLMPEEIVGKTDHEMPWADNAEIFIDEDKEVIRSGRTTIGMRRRLTRRDGSSAYIEWSKARLEDADGNIIGVLGMYRDVTHQQNMELKLAQKNKLESLGLLSAGLAHEINSPAQFVSDNIAFLEHAFADLKPLMQQVPTLKAWLRASAGQGRECDPVLPILDRIDAEFMAEEIPLAINQALDGIRRIESIVQSMKAFSKPESIEKTPTDLNAAIRDTVNVARNEWRAVADMILELDENLPDVACLPGEINQALLNIVVNAAQAVAETVSDSDSKGRIVISTRTKSGYAEIRIEDTGGGIPEDVQRHVFDQFFTTKEVGRGTGQGLAIAHHVVVDQHAGQLDFMSEPGNGTRFIVRLPIG